MARKKVFHNSDSDDDYPEHEKVDTIKQGSINEQDDSDSDAAPDDVTFSSSKEKSLQKVRDALNQIGNEKERQKQKRRIRNAQFKEQKKLKLEALEKNRLSADILETLESKPIEKKKEGIRAKLVKISQEDPTDSLNGESETETALYNETEEFIPLSSGKEGVKALYVMEALKATNSSAQKAKDFRQQRLYGGHIKRESYRNHVAKKKKNRLTKL